MSRKRSPWSARFTEPVDERVKRFTASVAFDRRLAKYDIRASLAHARMLAAKRVLSRRDLAAIQRGDEATQLIDLVAQPQAQVGRHLVVARARGMQPLARIADERGEASLDVEMHVLGVE